MKPVLQDTLDANQKTFRCWNYVTLVRWRKALELRYTTWNDPHFSVFWQDTDYANNDVSVKPNANSTDLSNIAKTFVQVCRGEDKCITITVYFAKTATRKKGCGSCLVQGKYCHEWVEREFEILCKVMDMLNDTDVEADSVSDMQLILPLTENTTAMSIKASASADSKKSDVNTASRPAVADSESTATNVNTTTMDDNADEEETKTTDLKTPTDVEKPTADVVQTTTDDDKAQTDVEEKFTYNVEKTSTDNKVPTDVEKSASGAEKNTTDDERVPTDGEKAITDIEQTTTDDKKTDVEGSTADVQKTSTDDENTQSDFETTMTDVEKTATDVKKATTTDIEKTAIDDEKTKTDVEETTNDVKKIVTDDEKNPTVVDKSTNDVKKTMTEDEKTTTGVETTALDSKTAVIGMGPAAPTASAGNEPDPTAPLNNCPHHFPVEPATCTCSNVSLCCYGCISETIRDLQAHFDGKIKAVCADFHSKLEDVQTENARLLDLVKKYKSVADRSQGKLHDLLNQRSCDNSLSNSKNSTTPKASVPDPPHSLDQRQQTNGNTSVEHQPKESLSASAQDMSLPSMPEHECSTLPTKQQRNDSFRNKEIRPLRLPREYVHTLLIGDSNLRKVERRRLDRSGGTHVRTFPGATVNDVTASLSKCSPRNDVKTVIIHVGGNDMKTDIDPPTLKSQYKQCIIQLKHAFPQARVLFTDIPPRKKTPSEALHGCNECLCNLCEEETIGFIPLFSDLQEAEKTLFAKYFDSDGIHLNERGVAHMLMRIIRHLRQPARKVGASLPQNKEARQITVHLSRRSSGVTTGPRLWSSVVKDVGPNPAEKPKHYVAHTPERDPNIVHSTDGKKLQEHYDRAMKGEEHRSRPSHHHHQHQPHIYQSFDPCQPYHPSSPLKGESYPIQPHFYQPYPHQPGHPQQSFPSSPYRRNAADVLPVPVNPNQSWWPYPPPPVMYYPWARPENARHSPHPNSVSNGYGL
ncbi:GDSL-type esterase/lipase family protein [Thiolapillus sp.]|uniref:GDSL-type esterase/lipase family protein n=8 Tax=Thiolapillus sp. TaxID=2017437 RepID=UPI003AF820CB